MKPKHTPGPWIIETYHGSLFKICKPDFKIGDEVTHRLEADARLISAAPEMFEAIDKVIMILEDGLFSGAIPNSKATRWAEMMNLLEPALVKARGE